MVSGDEIRKVIVAGNPDHMYSKDMFMLEEASVRKFIEHCLRPLIYSEGKNNRRASR